MLRTNVFLDPKMWQLILKKSGATVLGRLVKLLVERTT